MRFLLILMSLMVLPATPVLACQIGGVSTLFAERPVAPPPGMTVVRGRLVLDRLATREQWRRAARAPEGVRIGILHPQGRGAATPVYAQVTSCHALAGVLDGKTVHVFLVGRHRSATRTAPRRFAAIGHRLPGNVWETRNLER